MLAKFSSFTSWAQGLRQGGRIEWCKPEHADYKWGLLLSSYTKFGCNIIMVYMGCMGFTLNMQLLQTTIMQPLLARLESNLMVTTNTIRA